MMILMTPSCLHEIQGAVATKTVKQQAYLLGKMYHICPQFGGDWKMPTAPLHRFSQTARHLKHGVSEATINERTESIMKSAT